MFHLLADIYQNLKAHKWRSICTGFGVMWALFIFVILLSAGEGFRKGVLKKFDKYGTNTMVIDSIPNVQEGRIWFKLNMHTVEQLAHRFPFISHISPEFITKKPVISSAKTFKLDIRGVNNLFNKIELLEFCTGRFFTKYDNANEFAVCIIGNKVAENFASKKQAIGKYLFIDKIGFKIIGILSKEEKYYDKSIFIPEQIFRKYFLSEENLYIRMALQKQINPEKGEKKIRMFLAKKYHFDPNDQQILYFWNRGKVFKKFTTFFYWLKIGVWVIGLCFLLSGIVGISNMMLVVVKERTREIGIRKVVGATSKDILWMILLESMIVSLSTGSIGMLGGIGIIRMLNKYLLRITQINPNAITFMDSLTFHPSAAIASLFILLIAGCLAGLLPAKKAITIKPIQALNTE